MVFAHTLAGQPPSQWEPLAAHLGEVATDAAEFAEAFGCREFGDLLGRCHDLGKASVAFQHYLHQSSAREKEDASEEERESHGGLSRVNHSTFGARYLHRAVPAPLGHVLAFCVAGHHGRLPDYRAAPGDQEQSSLRYRLSEQCVIEPVVDADTWAGEIPRLTAPRFSRQQIAFQLSVLTRMLFSCLIDADRTRTEAFCQPEQATERRLPKPRLEQLRVQLTSFLDEKQRNAEATLVNDHRRRIREQCLAAAAQEPGFFSLQVPTGGGKTFASLAFALEHARQHTRLRRVVVAIPFTSIIEQTADVYRAALGSLAERGLIEHHTNVQPARATRANQLGSENWDAPLIVTTNVQLFESLFSAATTPCRKLHRLANSVIILDEAQVLPIELLTPTLAMLQELVRGYGCTVVLCTATQPALQRNDAFTIGLRNIRPIIQDADALYQAMKRVEVRPAGPTWQDNALSDDALVERLVAEPQVLCIVNTRRHAARLFAKLRAALPPDQPCFHLSTLMCGAHRRETLAHIREQLKRGPCRIVSTQLIEAGVDLDLPVVYRAATGFDSIAQAAGRCNREGRRALGHTFVFDVDARDLPPGYLRSAAETAKGLRSSHPDPLATTAIEAYFRDQYWKHSDLWDKHRIMDMTTIEQRPSIVPILQFREIGSAYKIIDDTQLPILIPYDPAASEISLQLITGRLDFVSQRQLQPYLVSAPKKAVDELVSEAILRLHESGVYLCLRELHDVYSPDTGLRLRSVGLDGSLWGV